MMRTRAASLLCSLSLVGGCFSTSHAPRDPRKVYMTMESGVRGYVRGGEFHSEMGFGGGLVEAVESNPRALEAADTFRGRMIGGFVGLFGGAMCLPGILAYDAAKQYDGRASIPDSHAYLAVGCGLAMVVGAFAMASAMPYQFDAINIFNDELDGPLPSQWVPPRFPSPVPSPVPSPAAGPPGGF
ncbi:MAG: hypothetical protein NT062_18645 [Proteobacteria bacterium]|nr:hypothetical protein [Pseudomonadota bacterium]